ncbi:hypothetical protein SAMN05444166_5836 [Singulisphaera sp. GP187]|uniref:hypothetical protein n=1 Tax=Singulisphaera sp. GP187 TaxID=1882752 RepID=UPI00092C1139|nr:hypothetical protein [Singulisphaera sp. GP187]SIO58853.1 hypothetical protein SAMN05444166_5836 [Singulisphaera sp. GP187]
MRLPRFTIRLWMVVVAILGIMLALPPASTVWILLILAIPTLLISQLPSRVRLAVEIPILLGLLVHSAYERQSRFYAMLADRTTRLACCASDWATVPKSSKARAILRRESAWFARRSVTLRREAIWKGFIHGPIYPSGRRTRQENCHLIDTLWEIQRHEDAARQAFEPLNPAYIQ